MGFAASRLSALLPTLKGKSLWYLPSLVVVWACARVKLYQEKLLVSDGSALGSQVAPVKTLPDWGICAILWSYDVLDPDGRFANFKGRVGM